MHAHNDNAPAPSSPRPAEFDAMLMQYRPGLLRLAKRLGFYGDDGEMLVTDTLIYCMEHWRAYRGSAPWEYLKYQMLNIYKAYRAQEQRQRMFVGRGDMPTYGTPSTQEHSADLCLAARRLKGRGGVVIARLAMGETYEEIGQRLGISRQRAQQIERVAREEFLARGGWGNARATAEQRHAA